ncbi:MAG: hypothetical protein QM768_18420 [Agriterribacter sp.]
MTEKYKDSFHCDPARMKLELKACGSGEAICQAAIQKLSIST